MLNQLFSRIFWFHVILLVCSGFCRADAGTGSIAHTNYWIPENPPQSHYKIDCLFDLSQGSCRGAELISFSNNTTGQIHRLTILWASLGNMQITANDKPVTVLAQNTVSPESSVTVFELSEPMQAGENMVLKVNFNLVAPEYLRKDKIVLPVWYPRLWWGFDTHDDFDVKITHSPDYTFAASGRLDSKTGYYHAEGIRRFGLFLGKGFETIEAEAQDVLIRCIFTPKGEKCAKLLLETAVDVINFYRERFGFYPHSTLTIFPGMDRPEGGYPMASAIVGIHGMEQMDKMPKIHWQWITAHEIGHQYCGEYMLSKDPTDSFDWLMIGLGIYADREYVSARQLQAVKHQGIINRYIEGVRKCLDTTVNRSEEEAEQFKFDFNNVVTHGKGYSIISALDCVLGKETFSRIYQRCLKQFGGKRLGHFEFRKICEETTGQNLGWFFEQWVNSNKYLSYEISSKKCEKKNNLYLSEVTVKRLGSLKMPIPVAAYFEDGTTQIKFTDRLLDTNILRFHSNTPLKEAQVDPNGNLALIIPPPPSPIEQQLIRKIKELPWTGAGKKALNVYEQAKDSDLSDSHTWFKLGLTLYDGKFYKEALHAYQSSQKTAQKDSSDDLISLVWQGHILDLLERRREALECYKEVLRKKQSNHKGIWMRHDQYSIKIDRKWVEDRLKSPFVRE